MESLVVSYAHPGPRANTACSKATPDSITTSVWHSHTFKACSSRSPQKALLQAPRRLRQLMLGCLPGLRSKVGCTRVTSNSLKSWDLHTARRAGLCSKAMAHLQLRSARQGSCIGAKGRLRAAELKDPRWSLGMKVPGWGLRASLGFKA